MIVRKFLTGGIIMKTRGNSIRKKLSALLAAAAILYLFLKGVFYGLALVYDKRVLSDEDVRG